MTDDAPIEPTKRAAGGKKRMRRQAAELATDANALAKAKRLLGGAAAGMLTGIALTAMGETTLGPWIAVLAMALGIGAAHTIGRCGPDPGHRLSR